MATWSAADGDFAGALGSAACTDGTNVYYKKTGSQIYKYTPPSTHTALTADTAFYNPTWWNGDLYALTHDYNNYLRVWKYSGSGTTWNQVLEIASANVEGPSRLIFNDTHLMVVVGLDASPWVTGRHTTDGSTWNTTTFEDGYTSQVTPDYSTQIGGDAGNARTCNHWQGFGGKQPVTQLSGNVDRIVQFNGTSEWLTRATISGADEFVASSAYYWRETGVADAYEWASTYTGTWTTPATDTIVPISQAGFSVPIGFLRSGSFVYFCYWSSDAADWVDSGESVIGLLNAYDFLDSCLRLSDGTVFIHWSRQAAHGWNVRSETLAADPDPAVAPTTGYGLTHSAAGIPGAILEAAA